jgi:lysophospholipase L1-like esterase
MKYLVLFALALFSFRAADPIKIVFFGDSITQQGVKPGGYVHQIQTAIAQKYPGKYEAIGAGIGGNKVYDLYLRMDEMLQHKPEIVVIYIGVNDVWHKTSHGTGTDPDKFLRFYERIIKDLKAKNIRVVLATPAVIGERHDASNPQDGDLNYYSQMIRELASKEKLDLVDLRKAFLDYSLKNNPADAEKGILTTDRVHLNEQGNTLVAERMMKTIFK